MFQQLDADGSGNISVAELLSVYDADHSGALDMKEMENLAARLTSQVRLRPALLYEALVL